MPLDPHTRPRLLRRNTVPQQIQLITDITSELLPRVLRRSPSRIGSPHLTVSTGMRGRDRIRLPTLPEPATRCRLVLVLRAGRPVLGLLLKRLRSSTQRRQLPPRHIRLRRHLPPHRRDIRRRPSHPTSHRPSPGTRVTDHLRRQPVLPVHGLPPCNQPLRHHHHTQAFPPPRGRRPTGRPESRTGQHPGLPTPGTHLVPHAALADDSDALRLPARRTGRTEPGRPEQVGLVLELTVAGDARLSRQTVNSIGRTPGNTSAVVGTG